MAIVSVISQQPFVLQMRIFLESLLDIQLRTRPQSSADVKAMQIPTLPKTLLAELSAKLSQR
jgi:hypothetical protein